MNGDDTTENPGPVRGTGGTEGNRTGGAGGSTSGAGTAGTATTPATAGGVGEATTTTPNAGEGAGSGGGSGGGAEDAGDWPPDLPRHLTKPIHIESMPAFPGSPAAGPASVQLQRSGVVDTASLALWAAIAHHTDAVSFNAFDAWVNQVLCQAQPVLGARPWVNLAEVSSDNLIGKIRAQVEHPGPGSYDLLMRAAEVFLLTQAGVWRFEVDASTGKLAAPLTFASPPPGPDAPPRDMLRLEPQPMTTDLLKTRLKTYLGVDANNYLETIIRANFGSPDLKLSPFCASYLDPTGPYLLELLWSYWMEQSMLVQGFNAILLRFQNVRRPETDPLAELDLDPLRPLNGFLWEWIQHEYRHLSVARRAYEYTHQYGLALSGKAVGELHPADPRTTFLAAFHNLLRLCSAFYKEDADTTYIADAFPLLNALKDLSLILSQGAGNQFRDLPWQARQEMLVQQWLMSRPELKSFLGGRSMVAYPEPWMSRVDSMRRLEKWGEVSVLHFNDLARFGERLLLSVRYGGWMGQSDQEVARTWARFWKPEVQGYLYAYKAVTGVDLASDQPDPRTGDLRYVQPALLLERQQVIIPVVAQVAPAGVPPVAPPPVA